MGDSAMPATRQAVTQVLEAATGSDLECAARELIVRA